MNNTSTKTGADSFEHIAQDAVASLIAASITLKLIGKQELARAVAESAHKCVDRAIALGGV